MKARIYDRVNVPNGLFIKALLLSIFNAKLQFVDQRLREYLYDIVHFAEKIIRPHHESIFFTNFFDTFKSDPMNVKILLFEHLQNVRE